MSRQRWVTCAAFLLACAVGMGAFGAHALSGRLDSYSRDVYEKAVFYQFIHALAILLVPTLIPWAVADEKECSRVCFLFLGGILFFCLSLYALAITGVKTFGIITPLGGVLFLCGWLMLATVVTRRTQRT